jgi:hypothetical protein
VKPDPGRFLEIAAQQLLGSIGPALPAGYAQSSVGLLAVMLLEVKTELDRAAARRVEENRALRGLFAESLSVLTDTALRDRLDAAARDEDESLLVSALERGNAALRSLLIELHAHVETLRTPEARRIEDAIWAELAASTERRRLALGPF